MNSRTAARVGPSLRAIATVLALSAPIEAHAQERAQPATTERSAVGEAQATQAGEARAQLLRERQRWQAQPTGLVLPTLLLATGLAAIGTGALLLALRSYDVCEPEVDCAAAHPFRVPGGITLASGALAVVVGGIMLVRRRAKRQRRATELLRLDEALQRIGTQTRLRLWLAPDTSQGTSAGFSALARF